MAAKTSFFFVTILILFTIRVPLFSQILLEEIGEVWSDFATDNGNRLPVTADTGLEWSDSYIGQLIDLPPHYGFGVTLAMNTLKVDKLNAFTEKLGIEEIKPWFAKKQFFPLYVLETRIGGFRDAPFDIGFKIGYFPALFDFFGDFQYQNLIFGGDLRWALLRGYGIEPKLVIGGGINYLSGYFLKKGYSAVWTGAYDLDTNGSDMRITWDVISFMVKVAVSKALFWDRITLFAGLNGGFSIAHTGIAILGKEWIYSGLAIKDQAPAAYTRIEENLTSEMGHDSKWELTDKMGQFAAWGSITTRPLSLNLYGGIAFDFDNDTHLQVQIMMDIAHLEYGLLLGWRWQQ